MIANLKPYPAMKDSGVPWLGRLPGHWDVLRLGQFGRLSKGNGGNKDDEVEAGVPCVRYGDLYTTHTYFVLKSRSFVSLERATAYTPIAFGDVLFAASGETIDDIGKSAVNLIPSEARCGGDVIVFRPGRAVDARYMGYATDCRPAAAQKATMGRGITVKHIYGDELKYLTIALPPIAEQAAIVRFLDHADRRIRRYIRAKQKLIKLLEEQKQAIIHRAVTRGLDPDVRVKPSGVEWLGDVPEHWKVMPVKRAFLSMDYGISESATDLGFIRLLTMGCIADGHVEVPATGGVASVDPSLLLNEDDLLFNRTNSPTLVGKVGHYKGHRTDVTFASLVRLRPRPEHDPGYLNTVLNDAAFLSIARREAIPSLHQSNLNPTRYGRLHVALPPLDEQRTILEAVDRKLEILRATIDRTRSETDLLRQYRTRLIADVVTGKLDVRDAAARLPDERDEAEPLDEAEHLPDTEEVTAEDLHPIPEVADA